MRIVIKPHLVPRSSTSSRGKNHRQKSSKSLSHPQIEDTPSSYFYLLNQNAKETLHRHFSKKLKQSEILSENLELISEEIQGRWPKKELEMEPIVELIPKDSRDRLLNELKIAKEIRDRLLNELKIEPINSQTEISPQSPINKEKDEVKVDSVDSAKESKFQVPINIELKKKEALNNLTKYLKQTQLVSWLTPICSEFEKACYVPSQDKALNEIKSTKDSCVVVTQTFIYKKETTKTSRYKSLIASLGVGAAGSQVSRGAVGSPALFSDEDQEGALRENIVFSLKLSLLASKEAKIKALRFFSRNMEFFAIQYINYQKFIDWMESLTDKDRQHMAKLKGAFFGIANLEFAARDFIQKVRIKPPLGTPGLPRVELFLIPSEFMSAIKVIIDNFPNLIEAALEHELDPIIEHWYQDNEQESLHRANRLKNEDKHIASMMSDLDREEDDSFYLQIIRADVTSNTRLDLSKEFFNEFPVDKKNRRLFVMGEQIRLRLDSKDPYDRGQIGRLFNDVSISFGKDMGEHLFPIDQYRQKLEEIIEKIKHPRRHSDRIKYPICVNKNNDLNLNGWLIVVNEFVKFLEEQARKEYISFKTCPITQADFLHRLHLLGERDHRDKNAAHQQLVSGFTKVFYGHISQYLTEHLGRGKLRPFFQFFIKRAGESQMGQTDYPALTVELFAEDEDLREAFFTAIIGSMVDFEISFSDSELRDLYLFYRGIINNYEKEFFKILKSNLIDTKSTSIDSWKNTFNLIRFFYINGFYERSSDVVEIIQSIVQVNLPQVALKSHQFESFQRMVTELMQQSSSSLLTFQLQIAWSKLSLQVPFINSNFSNVKSEEIKISDESSAELKVPHFDKRGLESAIVQNDDGQEILVGFIKDSTSYENRKKLLSYLLDLFPECMDCAQRYCGSQTPECDTIVTGIILVLHSKFTLINFDDKDIDTIQNFFISLGDQLFGSDVDYRLTCFASAIKELKQYEKNITELWPKVSDNPEFQAFHSDPKIHYLMVREGLIQVKKTEDELWKLVNSILEKTDKLTKRPNPIWAFLINDCLIKAKCAYLQANESWLAEILSDLEIHYRNEVLTRQISLLELYSTYQNLWGFHLKSHFIQSSSACKLAADDAIGTQIQAACNEAHNIVRLLKLIKELGLVIEFEEEKILSFNKNQLNNLFNEIWLKNYPTIINKLKEIGLGDLESVIDARINNDFVPEWALLIVEDAIKEHQSKLTSDYYKMAFRHEKNELVDIMVDKDIASTFAVPDPEKMKLRYKVQIINDFSDEISNLISNVTNGQVWFALQLASLKKAFLEFDKTKINVIYQMIEDKLGDKLRFDYHKLASEYGYDELKHLVKELKNVGASDYAKMLDKARGSEAPLDYASSVGNRLQKARKIINFYKYLGNLRFQPSWEKISTILQDCKKAILINDDALLDRCDSEIDNLYGGFFNALLNARQLSEIIKDPKIENSFDLVVDEIERAANNASSILELKKLRDILEDATLAVSETSLESRNQLAKDGKNLNDEGQSQEKAISYFLSRAIMKLENELSKKHKFKITIVEDQEQKNPLKPEIVVEVKKVEEIALQNQDIKLEHHDISIGSQRCDISFIKYDIQQEIKTFTSSNRDLFFQLKFIVADRIAHLTDPSAIQDLREYLKLECEKHLKSDQCRDLIKLVNFILLFKLIKSDSNLNFVDAMKQLMPYFEKNPLNGLLKIDKVTLSKRQLPLYKKFLEYCRLIQNESKSENINRIWSIARYYFIEHDPANAQMWAGRLSQMASARCAEIEPNIFDRTKKLVEDLEINDGSIKKQILALSRCYQRYGITDNQFDPYRKLLDFMNRIEKSDTDNALLNIRIEAREYYVQLENTTQISHSEIWIKRIEKAIDAHQLKTQVEGWTDNSINPVNTAREIDMRHAADLSGFSLPLSLSDGFLPLSLSQASLRSSLSKTSSYFSARQNGRKVSKRNVKHYSLGDGDFIRDKHSFSDKQSGNPFLLLRLPVSGDETAAPAFETAPVLKSNVISRIPDQISSEESSLERMELT